MVEILSDLVLAIFLIKKVGHKSAIFGQLPAFRHFRRHGKGQPMALGPYLIIAKLNPAPFGDLLFVSLKSKGHALNHYVDSLLDVFPAVGGRNAGGIYT